VGVSQANVDLVLSLQPRRAVDLTRLFRDDERWAAFTEAAASLYRSDFECSGNILGNERAGTGLDGLRGFWLDWLTPWATYATEPQQAIDLGQRVLVLSRSFGCLEGSMREVQEAPAAVWTVDGAMIARIEFYLERAAALKAVGLES
jgi:hypothetical protein